MTPDEIEAARVNAELERKLMAVGFITSCGISVFLIVMLLLSPLLALPATIVTWVAGYSLYRYLTRALPLLTDAWHIRRAFDRDDAAPIHDATGLTMQEQATFAAIEQAWRQA